MWFKYGLRASALSGRVEQGVWSSLAKLELLKNSVKDNKKAFLFGGF